MVRQIGSNVREHEVPLMLDDVLKMKQYNVKYIFFVLFLVFDDGTACTVPCNIFPPLTCFLSFHIERYFAEEIFRSFPLMKAYPRAFHSLRMFCWSPVTSESVCGAKKNIVAMNLKYPNSRYFGMAPSKCCIHTAVSRRKLLPGIGQSFCNDYFSYFT